MTSRAECATVIASEKVDPKSARRQSPTHGGLCVPRYDLIPSGPLLAVAEAFGIGATKYGDVPITEKPASYFIGALRRHLDAWEAGESRARDDGQHHLAAVAVRALQLMLVEGDPDLDDRDQSCAP